MSEAARSLHLVERPALADAARALTPVVAAPLDALDGVPTKIAARALAMAEIVAAFRAFRNRSCKALNAAGKDFCERFNHGQIDEVSASAREVWQSIKWPTLQKAWRRFEKSGIAGLVPGYGKRRGDSIIARNALMREFVISQIAHNPKVNAPFVLDGIKVRFQNDQIPSDDAVWKFMRDWKRQNHSLYVRIEDPAGWKNRHMLAIGDADANITRVNQYLEIDGTPADSYVLGTVETPGGRLHVMALIDVYSRVITAHLAPVESSNAVAELLIKAISLRGVPDEISHDNGAGFVSARTQRGIARLGIAWPGTPAYSGWKKPFIERGIGTTLHSFFANVPGFIGHDVKQASKIRERSGYAPGKGARRNMRRLYRIELTAPELQDLLDKWLEHVYGNKKHSGLGGRTPNEVFAEADRRGQVRRVADERLLDVLLGEDGVATVGKKGIRVDNAFYWDEGNALEGYIEQAVQYVRMRDQGRLWVFSGDGTKFICVAINPESAGLDRQVMAIAAKQDQNAKMTARMDELRAHKKKHKPENTYRDIIESCAARDAVRLPAPGTEIAALPYRSSGIAAATAALAALDTPSEPEPHSEEDLREGARAIEEMEQRKAAREADLSDDECWDLWKAIRRAGRALSEREQAFLSRFGNTPQSWAISYESSPYYQAELQIEKLNADEGQSHDKGNISCVRKCA
jgi:putative transposase